MKPNMKGEREGGRKGWTEDEMKKWIGGRLRDMNE